MFVTILLVAFLAVWIALYILVIRPKLVAYRYTAGIYKRLDVLEAGFWARALLWLKGLKVALIGLVTSSAPVVAVLYDKVQGLDFTQILPGEKAKVAGAVVLVLGVLGPMLMVILHNGALAEASAAEPQK